ncbi:MAG TPA: nickel-binding protein [Polyangiaceae bacterium]|nr:nickel-binding protein [Polyangiaceae bacterium]
MARIIVEQVFSEPLTDERYAAFSKAVDPCVQVRRGMWRRSSLSIDRLRMICEFEAPDAESVREAFRTAGVAFERAWTAEVYAVEDYPELMSKLRALVGPPAA